MTSERESTSIMEKLYSILIEPHHTIVGAWERQKASYLSTFLLLAIPLLAFASITSDLLQNASSTYLIAIILVALVYAITRTRYYHVGLVITLIGSTFLPLIIWFFGTNWVSSDIPRLMVWIFIALISGALFARPYVAVIQGVAIFFFMLYILGFVFYLPFYEYDSHLGTVGVITFFIAVIAFTLDSFIVKLGDQKADISRKQWELEVYTQLLRHDLRNDLQAILGSVELAQLLLELDVEEASENLDQSQKLGERMAQLLDVFSLPHEKPGTNIVEHITDVARESERVHVNLRINIKNSKEAGKMTFTASRLLPMVWTNIFRNAAQYAGPNPIVNVDISIRDDNFYVTINDNGPGIPVSEREWIFKRGSSNIQGKHGIGLYLSRIILESHGGSIEISPGNGASFVIRIPIVSNMIEP